MQQSFDEREEAGIATGRWFCLDLRQPAANDVFGEGQGCAAAPLTTGDRTAPHGQACRRPPTALLPTPRHPLQLPSMPRSGPDAASLTSHLRPCCSLFLSSSPSPPLSYPPQVRVSKFSRRHRPRQLIAGRSGAGSQCLTAARGTTRTHRLTGRLLFRPYFTPALPRARCRPCIHRGQLHRATQAAARA